MRFRNKMEGLIESGTDIYRWKFTPHGSYFSLTTLNDSLLFLTKIRYNAPAATAMERFAWLVLSAVEH